MDIQKIQEKFILVTDFLCGKLLDIIPGTQAVQYLAMGTVYLFLLMSVVFGGTFIGIFSWLVISGLIIWNCIPTKTNK